MSDWRRKRHPDDVPTPIAVAAADWCRRSGAAASAAEVREALATLSDDDDFRAQALAESEPEAALQGPYAMVDVIQGTDQAMAAHRQECGYYELVRQLVNARQAPSPATDGAPASGPKRTAASKASSVKAAAKPSVEERIAPKRIRSADVASPPSMEEEEQPTEPARRLKPVPRGRFTRLAPTRQRPETLLEADSKDLLATLLDQHPHRFSLLAALSEGFSGRGGALLDWQQVDEALQAHRLDKVLLRKERETVLTAFSEYKGAQGRVAWALGIRADELRVLIERTALGREVEELRERFRREALSPRNLNQRLDLLGRTKYLEDLGISRRFQESLTAELRSLVKQATEVSDDFHSLMTTLARQHAVVPQLLERALVRLKLDTELRKRLSDADVKASRQP